MSITDIRTDQATSAANAGQVDMKLEAEEALAVRGRQQVDDGVAPGGLTERGDVVRIPTEGGDVATDPSKRFPLRSLGRLCPRRSHTHHHNPWCRHHPRRLRHRRSRAPAPGRSGSRC